MNEYIFLYRLKDTDDRDCCAYIAKQPRFECGHYFGKVILHGACYSRHEFAPYEDIETILTKEEYQILMDYNQILEELGYGIEKGVERYKRGINAYKDTEYVFDKLNSDKAKEFFDEIVASEIEYIREEYNLSEQDIEYIFDHYYLDYRDRGIIGMVFENAYDCGYEEARSLGYINNEHTIIKRFFDFEKFGQALADEDEWYLKLDDGRIVYLNY